jgi:hypothetical protein
MLLTFNKYVGLFVFSFLGGKFKNSFLVSIKIDLCL